MKLLFSIPSGYHLRELVLPLRHHLEKSGIVSEVHILSPGAADSANIFTDFGSKFIFHKNPEKDEGYEKLFTEVKPDIVITNTVGHDALDEPILRIAKKLGIKTLTFIASWDNVWKIDRLIASSIPIAIADKFIVWNEMMKSHLIRILPSISEENILVIGAPRLDYFAQHDKIASKESVYKTLGFEDLSRPFVHISTTELYPMEYLVKTIRRGIDNGSIPKNPYMYASVHPGGSIERYKNFEQYGVTVRFSPGRRENSTIPSFKYVPTEEDVFLLAGIFSHAGVLINHSSTTALESLIAHVPVVNVRYGMMFDWWNWRRSMVYRDFKQHYKDLISDGATYVVRSNQELLNSIRDALINPHAKDIERNITVKKMITTTDGTASEKVLNSIISL